MMPIAQEENLATLEAEDSDHMCAKGITAYGTAQNFSLLQRVSPHANMFVN